jgi:hypothetical protein
LAAAIAVQPVPGFSCGCGPSSADSGTRPASRRCCCCSGSAQRCCCCGAARHGETGSKPQRTCCRQRADRDQAPAGVSTCNCGSGAPAAPPSVPAERSHPDDLAASALCAYVVTADVPAVRQQGWAIHLPAEFASASEHCIALCRLLF